MNAPVTEDVAWIRVDHESAIGSVRRAASGLATKLGFGESRAGEVGIAVTEVATNQLKHAGGGFVLLRVSRRADRPALEVVALDNGPGMRDVRASLVDGHSTALTLGIGLGAIARLASEWDAFSAPGRGTVLTLSFEGVGTPPPALVGRRAAGITRPMTGEELCGDAYALRVDDNVLTAMLVDGLGHGPLAARAADTAVRAFRAAPFGSPVVLLRIMHEVLRSTRGAAVAIVQLAGEEAHYAGVGNISGFVLDGEQRCGMISYAGIVGANVRTFREVAYEVPRDAVVVMHTDGVTDRIALRDGQALLARSPLVIAATMLRDFGVRNDDAGVLVVSGGSV